MKLSHLILVLLPALIAVESGGDWSKVGAAGERGGLQITTACIADVNRIYGLQGAQRFTQDDAYDPVQAKAICVAYLSHYGRGHESLEELARIWNGGPEGYKREKTLSYWFKVQNYLNATRPK